MARFLIAAWTSTKTFLANCGPMEADHVESEIPGYSMLPAVAIRLGNLSSVTDPNGNATAYIDDDLSRMISQTSPVTGVTGIRRSRFSSSLHNEVPRRVHGMRS